MPSLDVAINARKAKQGAAQFDDAVGRIRRGARDVNKSAARADKSLGGLGSQVKNVAIGLVGLGAAYKGFRFAISSVKEIAAFELNLANVSTMLNSQTMKYLPRYSMQISKLAVKYGQATGTLSKGLYDILSASVDASKAVNLLEVASQAAIGGMTDTGIAADALTTVLNSYSLSAEQAGHISDILFTIVKRGKLTFGELAGSIGHVAALAASSGLSIEEVGAALATMTRSGLSADIAVTSLKAILTTFLSPTRESIVAADKLGIALNTTTLRAIGLTGVVKKLTSATAEQRSEIFPNVRAITGLSTIVQDTTGHMRDLGEMTEASGARLVAFGKIANTTAQQIAKNREMIVGLKRDFGDALTPVVRDWMLGLSKLSDNWAANAVEVEKFYKIVKLMDKEEIDFGIAKLLIETEGGAAKIREMTAAFRIMIAEFEKGRKVPVLAEPHWSVLEEQAEAAAKAAAAFPQYTKEQVKAGLAVTALFKEIKAEKELIGLTNDERERAIKIIELESQAKILLGDRSGDITNMYKAELVAMQEARKEAERMQQYYDAVGESMRGAIRSPLTALLDDTRQIGDVLKDELRSLATDVLSMMYEDVITKPLMGAIKDSVAPAMSEITNVIMSMLSGIVVGAASGIGNIIGGGLSTMFGGRGLVLGAKGLVLDGSHIKQCAKGDILSGPTIFPMSNGGLAVGGEAGKEGLFPLGRDNQGRLGVRAVDDGNESGAQQIKIINVMDQSAVQEYLGTGDGERQIVNIMRRNSSILVG